MTGSTDQTGRNWSWSIRGSLRAARAADVYLAVRNGTNLALLNAIQNELIANDWIDQAFVDTHTIGFDGRAANEPTVTGWDPVSKQPYFKVAAVRLARVEPAGGDRRAD